VALSRTSPYIQSANRVSGLMLANHTSIRYLFSRCLNQYDRLMKRRAFLDNYEQHPMFEADLSEFDDSKEVVTQLAEEYKACESPDYIGGGGLLGGGGGGGHPSKGGYQMDTRMDHGDYRDDREPYRS